MKIQHKRSAVAPGGIAKEPTAAQTERGELCINFSREDPALFIKDVDENIIRVGGDLSLYQKKEEVAASTVVCRPDEIDGLSPPAVRGEGTLWWNTEDGVLYVWYKDADSEQWVITVPQTIPEALTQAEADGRYLRIDAGAGDQTRIAGKVQFSDTVSVKTSAGKNSTFQLNEGTTSLPLTLTQTATAGKLTNNASQPLIIESQPEADSENGLIQFKTKNQERVTINPDGDVNFKQLTTHENGVNVTGGNLKVGPGKIIALTTEQIGISSNLTVANTNPEIRGFQCGSQPGVTAQEIYGFQVSGNLNTYATATTRLAAFNSGIQANGDINYNIYAPGNAPNFLAGSTYIGGNTTRNTFDLWKSTLTEEQLEQYEAGNYAVPANVFVPGDGEYARQWYYNQQDVETQSLLDSGELEYPEHLAAGTFTDTFVLGDNTNINLNSNGNIDLVGKLDVRRSPNNHPQHIELVTDSGGNHLKSYSEGTAAKNFSFDMVKDGVTTTDWLWDYRGSFRVTSLQVAGAGTVAFNLRQKIDDNFDNVNFNAFSTIGTHWETGGVIENINHYAARGVSSSYRDDAQPVEKIVGFRADADLNLKDDNVTLAETTYGFYGGLEDPNAAQTTAGHKAYNFYAAGTAPNYFTGETVVNNILASRVEMHVQEENVDGSFPGVNNTINGCRLTNNGFAGFSTTNGEAFSLNRSGTDGDIVVFRKNGGVKGSIIVDDVTIGSPQLSDYRIKQNISDLTGATNVVKALRPVTFEYTDRAPGVLVDGFIAHEMEEVIPSTCRAIYGTKDATEPIGTLTDYDGTLLKENISEADVSNYEGGLTYEEQVEATPYVAAVEATYDEYGNELTAEVPEVEATYTTVTRTKTWTPTGTQPVYQGVDQTKLIPLLTKALQEALTRIEELESNTLQPLYSTLADLPDASDHHGKTAHVHSEGALYFAHAGNWVKLQNA